MLFLNANKNGRNLWHKRVETGKTAPNLVVVFFFSSFIYLVLAVLGLDCCPAVSPLAEGRGTRQLWRAGFSLWWLLLLQSMGSRTYGLQKLQHVGSVVSAPRL